MSKWVAEGDINSWLSRNQGKIASAARATGIDQAKLQAAAKGKAHLTVQDKKALRDYLRRSSPPPTGI